MTLNRPVWRTARFQHKVEIRRTSGIHDASGVWQPGQSIRPTYTPTGVTYAIPAVTPDGYTQWRHEDVDIVAHTQRTLTNPAGLTALGDGRYRWDGDKVNGGITRSFVFGDMFPPGTFSAGELRIQAIREAIAVVQPGMDMRDVREEGGRAEGALNFYFAEDVAAVIRTDKDAGGESTGDILVQEDDDPPIRYRALDKRLWKLGGGYQGYVMIIADHIEGQ